MTSTLSTEYTTSDTNLNTWFERDRAHIELETLDGDTIAEWWDDAVAELLEEIGTGGFILGRLINEDSLHSNVVDYVNEHGLVPAFEVSA